jgi:hypothetical protein
MLVSVKAQEKENQRMIFRCAQKAEELKTDQTNFILVLNQILTE